jgi:choline kinase
MEYIILAAGVGSRLYPYTKNKPKCLVKVTSQETVIQRCVRLIKESDNDANIHVIVGFQAQQIRDLLGDECSFILNPFYEVTNSIASLWFARKILEKKKDTVILNADIVFSKKFAQEICSKPSSSLIYYDSSIKHHGDYNVQVMDGKMVVMGKELSEYSGEYVGITKYTGNDTTILLNGILMMVNDGLYDQWYENGLVQMSLTLRHEFTVIDAADLQWSEIDSIDNLLKIRNIIKTENID